MPGLGPSEDAALPHCTQRGTVCPDHLLGQMSLLLVFAGCRATPPAGGSLIDFSERAPVLQTAVSSESVEKQMELTAKMMKQTGFA